MTNIIPHEAVKAFCHKYPIQKLSVFGSVLHDDFGDNSDIDVLVEFLPNARVGLFDMGQMASELSQILGREVDFVTKGFLSHYFRDQVLDEAVVIYEKVASE